MSTVVADILTGIKAIVVDELGSAYKELPFSVDVQKNRFAGGTKAYAAWAGVINEAASVNGYVTFDQSFQLKLTETFGAGQIGDAQQRAAALDLFNRMEAIYVRIASEKAGVPSRVMIVQRMSAQPVEFIDSNVAVLTATFDIKYRTAR